MDARFYLYETAPDDRPGIGFIEASLYDMDSSFAIDAFYRNRGASIGFRMANAYGKVELVNPYSSKLSMGAYFKMAIPADP